MQAAKNTPMTVSLAKPLRVRTKAMPAPTAMPKITIMGVTQFQNSPAGR